MATVTPSAGLEPALEAAGSLLAAAGWASMEVMSATCDTRGWDYTESPWQDWP